MTIMYDYDHRSSPDSIALNQPPPIMVGWRVRDPCLIKSEDSYLSFTVGFTLDELVCAEAGSGSTVGDLALWGRDDWPHASGKKVLQGGSPDGS